MTSLEEKIAKTIFEMESRRSFGYDSSEWGFLWADLNRRQREPYLQDAEVIIDIINNTNKKYDGWLGLPQQDNTR